MIDYEPSSIETSVATYWPPCWCQTRDQRVIRVNGLARGTIWDGMASAPVSLGITAPSAPSAAAASGGAAEAGDYYCAYRYKDNTNGTYSSLSPLTTQALTANQKITITGAASSESRVTHVEFYLSTVDESTTLYLVDTVANTGTPEAEWTGSDTTLADNTALVILNSDDTLNARKQGVPPNFKRVVVDFQDRMWYGVNAIYNEGTVSVTNGSANVTGTGTNFTSVMEGRYLHVAGGPVRYEIDTVTDTTHIVLSTTYGGTTNTSATYAIHAGVEEHNQLLYSEQDEPESVPSSQNTVVVQENTDDNDFITALNPHGSAMWVHKERHTYKLTFVRQPVIDAGVSLHCSRGCLNQNCFDYFEDQPYVMDANGPWKLVSSGTNNIGARIQDLWEDAGIDFARSKWFFVAVDPSTAIVRFFICLTSDTGTRPKTAFAHNVRTGEWWKETYPEEMSGKCKLEHGSI